MSETLLIPLHVEYIKHLASQKNSLTYHLTTHLRLNAIYWAVTALFLLKAEDALPQDDVVAYVLSCFDERQGAFGAHTGHDAHVLATLSGIQILFMYGRLDALGDDRSKRIVDYLLALQNPNTGEFSGDATGLEQDTRFTYCAIAALTLLSSLTDGQSAMPTDDQDIFLHDPVTRLDRQKTINAILAHYNFDGGFGRVAGSESHGSQAFVTIGALKLLGGLSCLSPAKRLRHEQWLCQRQLPSGGLNGRPQKLEDVCYSWWIASALAMLGKLRWINGKTLCTFILASQDPDNGGIADRPDNVADVFHTLFGVAGLSMLGRTSFAKTLAAVDPVYCLPAHIIARVPHLARPYQTL